jgi:hypothetical protein
VCALIVAGFDVEAFALHGVLSGCRLARRMLTLCAESKTLEENGHD